MKELGLKFSDIKQLTPLQIQFLAEGIMWLKKEEARAIRRARRRR